MKGDTITHNAMIDGYGVPFLAVGCDLGVIRVDQPTPNGVMNAAMHTPEAVLVAQVSLPAVAMNYPLLSPDEVVNSGIWWCVSHLARHAAH